MRLGFSGWLRWGWRQLTSMRTALVLLFLLALGAVPGSVLPQRPVDSAAVARYADAHPRLFPVFDALSLFDVFASPWFSAIYLLLFASLVGCVLPRTRRYVTTLRTPPGPAPRSLEGLAHYRAVSVGAPVPSAAVLEAAASKLRALRYRVRVRPEEISAERGRAREAGNLIFHAALLVLLVAVAVGHLWSFRADVVVVQGQSFTDVPAAFDSLRPGPRFDPASLPPFSLTLDRFQATYQVGGPQSGAPRSFRADVTWRPDPAGQPRSALIEPNHPLTVAGTKVFLTGNGYAPRLRIRDGAGHVVQDGPVPFLPRDGAMTSIGVVKLPDAVPEQLGVSALFLPTAVVDAERGPHSTFPDLRRPRLFLTAFRGNLGLDGGAPQSVFSLDTSRMTQLRDPANPSAPLARALAPGESLDLPGGLGRIEFLGVDRFVNFQVARDPAGAPGVAAAGCAMAGLLLSLFVRRRKVWVRVPPAVGGPPVVEVAGQSRTEDERLASDVMAVIGTLQATFGSDGARSDGARSDGARSIGADSDGAGSDAADMIEPAAGARGPALPQVNAPANTEEDEWTPRPSRR